MLLEVELVVVFKFILELVVFLVPFVVVLVGKAAVVVL